jgi:hypothetical protein
MAAMQEQMAAMQRRLEEVQRQESAVDASDLVTDTKVAEPEGKAEPVVAGEVTIDKPRRVVVS